MKNIIMLEGHDGSGKSTIAKSLVEKTGAQYVSFLREYDLIKYIDPPTLPPEEIVALTKRALDNLLSRKGSFVMDRGFLTPLSELPPQYWGELREYFNKIKTVICYADLPTTIERLKKGKETDESDVYNNQRYIDFYAKIAKRFNLPVVDTSANKDVKYNADLAMTFAQAESVDCVLIYPYLEDANWKNELRSKDNLALGYLTSCAREAGHSVKMIHAEHHKYSPEDVAKLVAQYQPKATGISITAQRAYPISKEYAERIKQVSKAPIFAGGILPTIAHKPMLEDCPQIDAICLGEGEQFIVDFLNNAVHGGNFSNVKGIAYRNRNGEVVANGKPNVTHDLDRLPLPAKDFFEDMGDEVKSGFYYGHISAGRGCHGNCSFCSMKGLTDSTNRRVRSPKSVVNEIKHMQETLGINWFYFVDEIFIDKNNPQWVYEFCEEMKRQKVKILFHAEARVDSISHPVIAALKEVGLDNVFLGFESGSQQMLDRYRKGHTTADAEQALQVLRDLDVSTEFGYIMIDPQLTFEQLKDNVEWILKIGGHTKHNLYNKLNLYYGTDLYKAIKQNANDGLPFYERRISYFDDPRVEEFSSLIDTSKDIFNTYNGRVNDFILRKVKEYKSSQNWQDAAERINDREIVVWENIVRNALAKASTGKGGEQEKWAQYVSGQVEYLDGQLDSIIAGKFRTPNINNNGTHVKRDRAKERFRPL